MPSRDACCFDSAIKCQVDKHYFAEGRCRNDYPREDCNSKALFLPRYCKNSIGGASFQCCDGQTIAWRYVNTKYSKHCVEFEDERVNHVLCPEEAPSASHFGVVSACIIVLVVVLIVGLAVVVLKRLRFNRLRTRNPRRVVVTGPDWASTPGSLSTAPRPPSVAANDLAPPTYEEAILLSDRPPGFDKVQ